MSAPPTGYLMGHTGNERRRLALQAQVLNPLTEDFLRRAGLAPGMSVLDLGCGVGDVAIVAARLVGPTGHVTTLDIDVDALDIAQLRASEAGFKHVSFEQANVAEYSAPELYDAVVGRHILLHMPDHLAVLRNAAGLVRAGGVVAFQEYDSSRYYPNTPPKPLYERTFQTLINLFKRVACADIGMRLFQMFQDVELADIQSRAEFVLDGGPKSPIYEWIAETMRSLLPKFEATGIATAEELDVNTLADRLKQEALAVGGCVAGPVLVGTFGHRL